MSVLGLIVWKLQSQIRLVDKVSSLVMYGLAASCIAEVVGLALGSLLAVGGVSGKTHSLFPHYQYNYSFKAPRRLNFLLCTVTMILMV